MYNKYLIVARDKSELKIYLINTHTKSAAKARDRFKEIVKGEGWKPFEEIAAFSLNSTTEFQNLITFNM